MRVITVLLLSALLVTACRSAKKASEPVTKQTCGSLRKRLAESSTGSRAFFVPAACLAFLPEEKTIRLPSPSESTEVLSCPSKFGALNREYRFDRVFLLPGALCAPLRDRLLDSPLWVLSQIGPEGYLFGIAGQTPWHTPDAQEIERLVPDPKERASWLTGTAANLLAIGRNGDAASLLAMASCTGPQEGERLALLASLEASTGHWHQALNLASQALRYDTRNRTATIVLIRGHAETGNPQMALTKAQEFVRATADAESLFLLARVANAAGDHAVEIDALTRLVGLGLKNHQPVGASLLYLGQALARDGQRAEALRALDEARVAIELTAEQKELIRELRDHLSPSTQAKLP